MISLKGRHYIETQDFTREEIDYLLAKSVELKNKFHQGVPHPELPRQTVYLLFFDKSTRTRNAFEAGITQLGGHAHFLEPGSLQISHGESAKDTALILGAMGHGIAIRHDLIPEMGNSYMREVAKWSPVPVINMQCDVDHPTQTLADLMTMREHFGTDDLRGKKIAVSWAFAPSYAKPLSVPQGLITLMTRMGMHVTLAHPPEYNLMKRTVESAEKNAKESGGSFQIVDNMKDAFDGADIVYPKSWGTYDIMLQKRDAKNNAEIDTLEKECLKLNAKYKSWICDEKLMTVAQEERHLHALLARRPRLGSHRRRDRRPAIGRLPGSREPPAHGQGHHGQRHARATLPREDPLSVCFFQVSEPGAFREGGRPICFLFLF
jgi:ornithine carbamoyltransferase